MSKHEETPKKCYYHSGYALDLDKLKEIISNVERQKELNSKGNGKLVFRISEYIQPNSDKTYETRYIGELGLEDVPPEDRECDELLEVQYVMMRACPEPPGCSR